MHSATVMKFHVPELIIKKRSGQAHTPDELRFIIESFTAGTLPEYQMSAWLMAVYFKGMTGDETANLTELMLASGKQADFSRLGRPAIDKHSTGGVGDKTSLILAPLVAAAGVPVPMIAGRGLGHTGGTLDKLESIPGFSVDLSFEEFERQVAANGVALIGQTTQICPADKKIYALRDVTGTVESLPLICGSIMSKKLAEGISGLVMDVKFGSGAFMKTLAQAEELALKLMEIGAHHGKKVVSLLTNMNQPLGRFVGNSLEVGECIAILKNESFLGHDVPSFDDTLELTLRLAAEMIFLGGKAPSPEKGYEIALATLRSGQAYEKFCELIARQGGKLEGLSQISAGQTIFAKTSGFLSSIQTDRVGLAAISLGAGRSQATDVLDLQAGIELCSKLGDEVKVGEPLFHLRSKNTASFAAAEQALSSAVTISLQKPAPESLIEKRVTSWEAFS